MAKAVLPVLGQFGFLLLGITAVISTSTKINANIFSVENTTSYMAGEKFISSGLAKKKIGSQGTWAMIITVFLVIIILLYLAQIARLTSLLVHTFLPLGNILNKVKETHTNKFVYGWQYY